MRDKSTNSLKKIEFIENRIVYFENQSHLLAEDKQLVLEFLKNQIDQLVKKLREGFEKVDVGIKLELKVFSKKENEGLRLFLPNGNKKGRCIRCPIKQLREIYLSIKGVNFEECAFCHHHAQLFFVSELCRKDRLENKEVLEKIREKLWNKKELESKQIRYL